MKLQHATWPEVDDYLSRSTGIVIPTGSTEQHGVDGAIGTDAICAEEVADAAARLHGQLLIAPTLALTPAQFNLGFAGTISVRATTFISMLCDIIDSLSRSGFSHIYIVNGHGANIAAIRAAFHDTHQSRSESDAPLWLRHRSWWEFEEADAMRKNLYGDREGLHATPSEISMTLASQAITGPIMATERFTALDAMQLKTLGGDNHDVWYRHRQQHPDGRVGSDPGTSNAVDGQNLIDAAARGLVEDFQAFVSNQNEIPQL